MRTRLVRPEYAERFRCIGPTCEDSCCVGWRVDIDKATYIKYQSISPGSLRVLIDANIVRTFEGPVGKKPSRFAQVKMGRPGRARFTTRKSFARFRWSLVTSISPRPAPIIRAKASWSTSLLTRR